MLKVLYGLFSSELMFDISTEVCRVYLAFLFFIKEHWVWGRLMFASLL